MGNAFHQQILNLQQQNMKKATSTFSQYFDKYISDYLDRNPSIMMGDIEACQKDPFQGWKDKWTFYHHCGSRGGVYRISKKGNCYSSKCKEELPSYENLVMAVKLVKFNDGN
jgi:hypothetical protein